MPTLYMESENMREGLKYEKQNHDRINYLCSPSIVLKRI